jgi:hypothetical protein
MQNNISTQDVSFKDFLFKYRRNRIILFGATAAIVIQFAIFKYLYPYASYIHGDSFSYIGAAYNNFSISTYPIGYSKFLRLFSVFAMPDYILVAFQYLFIQFSVLFLLFTIFYFYNIGKVVQTVLICFMVFNPLFLHLGNLVSSDGFFLALSCNWFALLLWVVHKPSTKIMIWHGLILLMAFTVRYNAIIYPLIAGVAFGFSKISKQKRLLGFGLGLFLCGLFVGFNMYQYKRLTRHWQFSPFSGWLRANNAMYAYRYVDAKERKPVPIKFKLLDKMITQFFDSTRDTKIFPTEKIMASTFYMWSPAMPLMKYRNSFFKKDTLVTEFKKWAIMGPIYGEYGNYIIKKYPWHFARYFLWPNANKYYAPSVEFLESYNSGKDDVLPLAQKWFGYKTLKVKTRMNDKEVWILNFYPILSGIINVFMFFLLIFYLSLKGWKYNVDFKKGICLGASLWLLNAVFTISVSSAALRFQSFPIILTTIFVASLVDWMLQLIAIIKKKTITSVKISENMKNCLIPDALT